MRQMCTMGGEKTSKCQCIRCAKPGHSSHVTTFNQMATAPPSGLTPTLVFLPKSDGRNGLVRPRVGLHGSPHAVADGFRHF